MTVWQERADDRLVHLFSPRFRHHLQGVDSLDARALCRPLCFFRAVHAPIELVSVRQHLLQPDMLLDCAFTMSAPLGLFSWKNQGNDFQPDTTNV
jgi:hypothetical protein